MSNSVVRQRVAHASLLDYASKNRDEGFFSDVTIIAENESIAANRLVLSCYSNYFEKMFKLQMRERYEHTINMKEIDGQSMVMLIDFIYTGSITISDKNVISLLSGADYIQLEDVKQFCLDFLQSHVSPDNSLDILNASILYSNDQLKNNMLNYIKKNLLDIAQTDSFKALSKEKLVYYLTELELQQTRDIAMYEAIIKWIYHEAERETNFPELFKLVNLRNLPMDFLEEIVLEEKLVKSYPKCEKLALSTYRQMIIAYKIVIDESKLLSIGGKRTREKVTIVHNLHNKSTITFPDLPQRLACHCSLKWHDRLYCIGGEVENTNDEFGGISSTVWSLDLRNEHSNWIQIASMNEKRKVMDATVFSDTLVVAGGDDENKQPISSAEFYLAPLNEWKSFSSMKEPRWGNALVACNGYLYALGGWGNGKNLTSVERLKDLKSDWEYAEPMQIPRRWLAAVNCCDKIYAIGGQCGKDSCKTEKTVEKYDVTTNQWNFVKDMNFARRSFSACVVQDKIYVVGGLDVNSHVVKEIECYDPVSGEWDIVGNTKDELYFHSLVAL